MDFYVHVRGRVQRVHVHVVCGTELGKRFSRKTGDRSVRTLQRKRCAAASQALRAGAASAPQAGAAKVPFGVGLTWHGARRLSRSWCGPVRGKTADR